ncbi:P-II family nitrogen regulator [Sedimentibacter sp.]|uniref:P-II family nitrogen regulator n=2 Tax=Sedimentibacter sp. TaxID=1960295 RepID=UPI0028A72A28|nr:P-II family nitrogen regulator [Sedimentibacter sp.]
MIESEIMVDIKDDYQEFDLIITIVNRGFDDVVMDAARSAGATGGTVLNARGTGVHEAEKFFGISIQPEKDVILILAKRKDKKQIMHAIRNEAGLNKEGRGLSFSMPVEDVCGIVHMKLDFKDK